MVTVDVEPVGRLRLSVPVVVLPLLVPSPAAAGGSFCAPGVSIEKGVEGLLDAASESVTSV